MQFTNALFDTEHRETIDPIFYLHMPESGSGWATTVAHHACKGTIPDDLLVLEPADFFASWGTSCNRSLFRRFKSGHQPLTATTDEGLSHVVVMIRDPIQRILSGYYNGFHDCSELRQKYNCKTSELTGNLRCDGDIELEDGSTIRDGAAIPPLDYARCVENCSANMLTGRVCSQKGEVQVEQAVDRINKLGFVGLTDEWALSVCLWHRRFGGKPLPAELNHEGQGFVTSVAGGVGMYNERALLGTWKPDVESIIYQAAEKRFWSEIESYQVTRQACNHVLEFRTLEDPPFERESVLREVHYLYVPQSGAGFATTIAHHTCGEDIPSHISVSEPSDFFKMWGEACNRSRFLQFKSGHDPLDNSTDLSSVVMLMRDPLQRILSGYYNDLHDCWSLRRKHHCRTSETTGLYRCDGDTETADGRNLRDPRTISPVDYGKCVENCSANMLTGRQCSHQGSVDVEGAVNKIKEMAFVGLSEEWSLSVCLWHKKFGGRMLSAEFQQEGRGDMMDVLGGSGKYNKHTLLGRWRPRGELAVYEAAVSRFWKEIKHYGITRESCELESRDRLEPTENIEAYETIDPIRYVRLPNSGPTFATTIAHHACGTKIPGGLAVSEPAEFFEKWSKSCPRTMFRHFKSDHEPLNLHEIEDVKHGVVMVREPSQRILSGYYDNLADCWQLRAKYGCKIQNDTGKFRCDGDIETEDGRFLRNIRAIPPYEYGRCVENCSANMLTGRGCADSGPVDVNRATEIIDKLGFVGLTDEWALSVCLWHKRFGGRYIPAEFQIPGSHDVNTVTGGVVKFDPHALFGHWRPTSDMTVFEAATRRFWKDIERYGVSRRECEETRSRAELIPEVDINPILYLHIPQSGSGFATTIAHHACGNDIPENVAVQEPSLFFKAWEQKCSRSRFRRFRSGHDPFVFENSDDLSHLVMMVRKPTQRVIAGYFDDLHDCWDLRRKYGCRQSNGNGKLVCDGDNVTQEGNMRNPRVIPPIEYGQCVENCTANLLTGRPCGSSGEVNTTKALSRVFEAGFVGLTDEWAMSICLWHKRFGGRLLPAELRHIEPGMSSIGSTAGGGKFDHSSLLGQWKPAIDTLIFEAATHRFWNDIEFYKVDRGVCEKEVFDLLVTAPDDALADSAIGGVQTGKDINPIFYMHVPESGAGFATVVAHHVCGATIPENVAVIEPSAFFRRWGWRCDHSLFHRFQSGHAPLILEETNAGHAVMMFREPTQRILSGYFNNLHGCYDLQRKYNCSSSGENEPVVCSEDLMSVDGQSMRNSRAIPVEYGKCVENCTANMLAGRDCAAEGEPDVDAALRVVDSLGFVGLSDEWTLSVCLWHKKFGGHMLPAELANVRPGRIAGASSGFLEYDEHSFLGWWRPKADVQIYEAASRRFWAELDKFGVTRASCELEARMVLEDSKQIYIAEIGTVDITPQMLPAPDVDPSSQISDINPIYYLHVPYSGSGFATTVAHHTCGSALQDDIAVPDPGDMNFSLAPSCNKSKFMHFQSGHDPLSVSDESEVAHVVMMMRDPTQRALSGYFDDLHDCAAIRLKYNCSSNRCYGDIRREDGQFIRNPRAIPPAEYAQCVENCTANMLTGRECSSSGSVDVGRALAVVNRLGFVGLTEEWVLSVCLWHKRFGGRMLPAELANVRPGSMTVATEGFARYNDHALLGQWQPAADVAVFEAAKARFWREIKIFGITREDCQQQAQHLEQQVLQVRILGQSTETAADIGNVGDVVDGSVNDINPIYYLHMPESGSGFATTVLRHACADQIPEDLEVHEPDGFIAARFPSCNESHFFSFKSGHEPLGISTDADLAHAVVMIRDPSQRVLAGYYNDLHECDALKLKYNCSKESGSFRCDGDTLRDDGRFVRDVRKIRPREYGSCVENCSANMLTGRRCSQPGAVDVRRAIDVIGKLGFVGLTDEWTLSICLWHKMFGGRAVPAEFKNQNPGLMAARSHAFGSYDQHALLGHWRPHADTLIHEAASRRFWSDIERFGVDDATCEREAFELAQSYQGSRAGVVEEASQRSSFR
jgi:hypothetical protein